MSEISRSKAEIIASKICYISDQHERWKAIVAAILSAEVCNDDFQVAAYNNAMTKHVITDEHAAFYRWRQANPDASVAEAFKAGASHGTLEKPRP